VYAHAGIKDFDLIDRFFDVYYKDFDREYNPGTEEYKEILKVFDSINQEIL
jgi:hypothetical protein